jgi:hypothetical protein
VGGNGINLLFGWVDIVIMWPCRKRQTSNIAKYFPRKIKKVMFLIAELVVIYASILM